MEFLDLGARRHWRMLGLMEDMMLICIVLNVLLCLKDDVYKMLLVLLMMPMYQLTLRKC